MHTYARPLCRNAHPSHKPGISQTSARHQPDISQTPRTLGRSRRLASSEVSRVLLA